MTQNSEKGIIEAIRVFLTKEKLDNTDAYVFAVLLYSPSTIITAMATYEESAVLVPDIPRDTTKKFEHQLAIIFDGLAEGLEHPVTKLPDSEIKKLRQVMAKYGN